MDPSKVLNQDLFNLLAQLCVHRSTIYREFKRNKDGSAYSFARTHKLNLKRKFRNCATGRSASNTTTVFGAKTPPLLRMSSRALHHLPLCPRHQALLYPVSQRLPSPLQPQPSLATPPNLKFLINIALIEKFCYLYTKKIYIFRFYEHFT